MYEPLFSIARMQLYVWITKLGVISSEKLLQYCDVSGLLRFQKVYKRDIINNS